MKATGIVRRIDDLGRVVIPKEIRKVLKIREGDPLEIFVEREGEVILKNILRYPRSNRTESLYARRFIASAGFRQCFVTVTKSNLRREKSRARLQGISCPPRSGRQLRSAADISCRRKSTSSCVRTVKKRLKPCSP